jgi:hypothetical protein
VSLEQASPTDRYLPLVNNPDFNNDKHSTHEASAIGARFEVHPISLQSPATEQPFLLAVEPVNNPELLSAAEISQWL